MSKGIYTSLAGALAQGRRVESIANNLANSKTVGYKKDELTFKEQLSALTDPAKDPPVPTQEFSSSQFYQLHGADKSFVTTDAQYTDHSQGSLKPTNRDLDMSISGQGFFEIATPRGVRYTRNGVFNRSADGRLVTLEGYPVLSKTDAASPEAFSDPNNRAITLGKGKIHVAENGDLFVDGNFTASLQVTEFVDPTLLQKEGGNQFINAKATNILPGPSTSSVVQRHVEESNVNPVAEMVNLLEAQKLFDQNMKNIKQFDDLAARAASDIAKF